MLPGRSDVVSVGIHANACYGARTMKCLGRLRQVCARPGCPTMATGSTNKVHRSPKEAVLGQDFGGSVAELSFCIIGPRQNKTRANDKSPQ